MTFDQIIEAAEAATCEKTVMVPSNDCYRRDGDLEREYIRFIDADLFIEKLRELDALSGVKE